MKSLKTKTILLIILLLVLSITVTIAVTIFRSNGVMNQVVDTQLSDRLISAESMMRVYLSEEFGTLAINKDGIMVDSNGNPIEGRYEYIDTLAESLGVEATIFAKGGNDYVRVLTSIVGDDGSRVVGTVLDPQGQAYESMNQRETYIGVAGILGTNYIAVYSPMIGDGGEIIGLYFVGVPNANIEEIVSNGLRETLVFVLMTTLVILLMVGFLSFKLGNYIVDPVIAVTDKLNKFSDLDFSFNEMDNVKRYANREDEIGIMSNSLTTMQDNIVEFITKTTDSAEQVAASSQELTATSAQASTASEEVVKAIDEIAKGAGNQAEDTENTARHIQELGDLLDQDAINITELNKAAGLIDKQKEEGFIILKELIEKTDKTNKATRDIYDITLSNNESAAKIERASSMIESIAEQTNLLALNAAIEAARAGESGRGFAVVADEIRKLAEESSRFTSDIKSVINELKTKLQHAVNTMDQVKEIVSEQGESVNETEIRFEGIANATVQVKDVTDKLNKSAELMTRNKEIIIDLVQNLSAIAEENAAGTEEATASMEEQAATIEEIAQSGEGLSLIAEELRVLINKFKV